jgi:hypothetical protein
MVCGITTCQRKLRGGLPGPGPDSVVDAGLHATSTQGKSVLSSRLGFRARSSPWPSRGGPPRPPPPGLRIGEVGTGLRMQECLLELRAIRAIRACADAVRFLAGSRMNSDELETTSRSTGSSTLTVSRRIQRFTAPRKSRDRSRDQLVLKTGRDCCCSPNQPTRGPLITVPAAPRCSARSRHAAAMLSAPPMNGLLSTWCR